MRVPGTVTASPFLRRTTVNPDRKRIPGGVRQPVKIVVVDASRQRSSASFTQEQEHGLINDARTFTFIRAWGPRT
jgi:hypothetical protein